MAAGYPITASDVNTKAGSLVTSLWDNLNDLNKLYRWMTDAAHTDAFLNGIGITGSASTGDVKALRDSVADLGSTTNGLYAVSHGLFVPGGVNNFFANAKLLTGVNYTG